MSLIFLSPALGHKLEVAHGLPGPFKAEEGEEDDEHEIEAAHRQHHTQVTTKVLRADETVVRGQSVEEEGPEGHGRELGQVCARQKMK